MKKNKAAQEMAKRRNKKVGKKWLKENAHKMVDARKAKALHLEVCERYKAGFVCPKYNVRKV